MCLGPIEGRTDRLVDDTDGKCEGKLDLQPHDPENRRPRKKQIWSEVKFSALNNKSEMLC